MINEPETEPEPYQAKFDKLNSSSTMMNEPETEILEAVNYVGIYQKKKINHMELIIENKEEIKDDKEEIKDDKTKKKKKNQEINTVFNIDMFEEINGYELIEYKGDYYLRDLETNELYNIKNNQPNKVIGLINSKSKVKFN
jgi:hypothetical protein